jgi:hypothetical protein
LFQLLEKRGLWQAGLLGRKGSVCLNKGIVLIALSERSSNAEDALHANIGGAR